MREREGSISVLGQSPARAASIRQVFTWALATGTLFVAVGAAGGKRLAHQVDLGDLAQATHDPLLDGAVPAPPEALVNDPGELSPKEPPHRVNQ